MFVHCTKPRYTPRTTIWYNLNGSLGLDKILEHHFTQSKLVGFVHFQKICPVDLQINGRRNHHNLILREATAEASKQNKLQFLDVRFWLANELLVEIINSSVENETGK